MAERVKDFRYLEQLDAFDVTDEYRAVAEDLGLVEWNPVVWIGRLFTMDNDLGEHWFDNWEIRASGSAAASKLGLDSTNLLYIDPERFQDGRDGPCHSADFRKRFWTSVLRSLELDLDLLIDEARAFNARSKSRLDENPDDPDYLEEYLPDLESRIAKWAKESDPSD